MTLLQLISENVYLAIYEFIKTNDLNTRLAEELSKLPVQQVYTTQGDYDNNVKAMTILFENGELN